jgi:hypothetical protein
MMKVTVNPGRSYLNFSDASVYDISARLILPDFCTDLFLKCGQKFLIASKHLSHHAQINPGSNLTSSVEIRINDEQTFRFGLKVKTNSWPYGVSGPK